MTDDEFNEIKRLRETKRTNMEELNRLTSLANKWMTAYAEIEDLLFAINDFCMTHPRKFKASGVKMKRVRK